MLIYFQGLLMHSKEEYTFYLTVNETVKTYTHTHTYPCVDYDYLNFS